MPESKVCEYEIRDPKLRLCGLAFCAHGNCPQHECVKCRPMRCSSCGRDVMLNEDGTERPGNAPPCEDC